MEIAFSFSVERLSKEKTQLNEGRKLVSKHTEALLLDQKLGSNSNFLGSATVEAIIL